MTCLRVGPWCRPVVNGIGVMRGRGEAHCRFGSRLALGTTHAALPASDESCDPRPQPAERAGPISEMGFPARLFARATCLYPPLRPGGAPNDFAVPNPVMRAARALPVANRRVERYTKGTDGQAPLRRPQGSTNLGTTSTGAQVSGRAKPFSDIENPRLQIFRDVLHSLELDSQRTPSLYDLSSATLNKRCSSGKVCP